MPKDISVNNFDEVKKHLRDELKILGAKLERSITNLRAADNINATDILKLEKIKDSVSMLTAMYDEFVKHMELKPVINVTTPDVNIPEIKVPDITVNVPEVKLPTINVPAAEVTVNTDFSKLEEIIGGLSEALKPLERLSDDPEKPISVRISDGEKWQEMLDGVVGAAQQMFSVSSMPTDIRINNTSANPVPITGTISVDTTGLATAAGQTTGNTSLSSIDGKITACNTGAVVVSSGSITATQGTATNLKTQAENYQGGTAVGAANPLQVTLANGSVPSHAVTNAGTFAVQVDGSALTALQLIDDPVATTASAIPSKGMAISGTDGTNARIIKTDTSGELQVDVLTLPSNASVNIAQMNGVTTSMGAGATGTGVQRVVLANDAGKTIVSAGGSASSSGNNTLVAAGTNKLKVHAFSLTTTSTTAMTCIFQSGAGGTELWRCIIQAPSGASAGANLSISPPAYLFATASATLLNLNLSSANAVHWSVSYVDEA